MQSRPASDNNGFTLIEVLISLVIMATVLVAVFKLHAQSLSISATTQFHTTAALLSHAKLTEIKSTPFAELTSESGGFAQPFADYRWQATIEDIAADNLGQINTQLKKSPSPSCSVRISTVTT